jgi:ATP-dependent DNA helicase RecQ
LRTWRTKRATADGVPAYIIAHDTVLEDLCKRQPITAQQLLGIKGFGPSKAEKYAEDILAIIAAHAD